MRHRIFARFVVFMVTFVVLYGAAAALGLLAD
jgi:hypothetical protein